MRAFQKLNDHLLRLLVGVGGICLAAMCLLTCANILLRMTWIPIRGTFELMGFLGAVATAFALAHTQRKRNHIAVDVLVSKFSPAVRRGLNVINGALCAAFFALAAWQVADKAGFLKRSGELTETLRIAYYPFVYAVALGCLALVLVLVLDTIRAAKPPGEEPP